MYPIRLFPSYQHYVWGGKRLVEKYHRDLAEGIYAESWEVSDRAEGQSVVANGKWKGKGLKALVEEMGEALVGKGRGGFPLLIKLIDAKENLSIQVHPDEVVAQKLGAEAKHEAWVLLEKGVVYAGFKGNTSQEEVESAVHEKRLETLLERLEMEPFEAIDIPAGTIHAIGAGSFLLEVQQNSNTTYRVYDWGRDRELHLKPALEALSFQKGKGKAERRILEEKEGLYWVEQVRSRHFVIERIELKGVLDLEVDPSSFQVLFFDEGEGRVIVDQEEERAKIGESFLIPAASSSLRIEGEVRVFRIFVPSIH